MWTGELLLKVGNQEGTPNGYLDSDVICAFNRRRIRCVHAEHLCHVKNSPYNSYGYRYEESLANDFRANAYRWKFAQVSRNEHMRFDRITGKTKLIYEPNLRLWLYRRLQHVRHAIFGFPGKAVWYGGELDRSNIVLDKIWDRITWHTGKLETESEFRYWPMGRLDIRHHLPLVVEDFSDDEAERLVKPLFIDEELVMKRTAYIDYMPLLSRLGATIEKVLDRNCPVRSLTVFKWRELNKLPQRMRRELPTKRKALIECLT